jgi:hypothetical protein
MTQTEALEAKSIVVEGVIEPDEQEQAEAAKRLDVKIRLEWQASERSLVKVAGSFTKMRDEKLWLRLVDIGTKKAYKRFEDYVTAVTGNRIARSKLYELLSIWGLTQGADALDPKDVEEMGPKNAAEIARLDAKDRTPEVVEKAKKESTRKLKKLVQEKLNEKLAPEERKDPTFMFARNLDEPTIELIEQVEHDLIWCDFVRNGDKSVSQLVKAWNLVWAGFVISAEGKKLMDEGRDYREAMEAAKAEALVPANETVDVEEAPPPEPDEQETLASARDYMFDK